MTSSSRYTVIMAGGSGTRLWPMSRAQTPKQMIPLVQRSPGGPRVSLLELAFERACAVTDRARVLVCAGAAFEHQIRALLPTLGAENYLGEPVGRDTVNAVGLAASVLHARDPDARVCVLTADHLIEPTDSFAHAINAGFALVEADRRRLVTFSITPTHAATGFGYVELGRAIDLPSAADAFEVERFVEKPDRATAEAYLASGRFGWNSGMFVWSAATLMDHLHQHMPSNAAALREIAAGLRSGRDRATIDRLYPQLPKKSVDYAIMEPASALRPRIVCAVRMDVSWLDIGSWPSLAQTLEPDASGNRASGASLVAHASRGCAAIGQPGHTIALVGCEDLIVVHTPDATLVMPASRAEELKSLHGLLSERLR